MLNVGDGPVVESPGPRPSYRAGVSQLLLPRVDVATVSPLEARRRRQDPSSVSRLDVAVSWAVPAGREGKLRCFIDARSHGCQHVMRALKANCDVGFRKHVWFLSTKSPGSSVVGNARALGARDRGFESRLPDHRSPPGLVAVVASSAHRRRPQRHDGERPDQQTRRHVHPPQSSRCDP